MNNVQWLGDDRWRGACLSLNCAAAPRDLACENASTRAKMSVATREIIVTCGLASVACGLAFVGGVSVPLSSVVWKPTPTPRAMRDRRTTDLVDHRELRVDEDCSEEGGDDGGVALTSNVSSANRKGRVRGKASPSGAQRSMESGTS
eukprot:6406050-Prymnesium_polylepis.1